MAHGRAVFPYRRSAERVDRTPPDSAPSSRGGDAAPHGDADGPVLSGHIRAADGTRDRERPAGRRGRARPHDRAGRESDRRRPGPDAGLQRLDPGTEPAGAAGRRDRRTRDERCRRRGDRALARAAAREPLRRRAPRHPEADPHRGELHYRVRFPDEGLYWYHPHIREDYTQDSGLYGDDRRGAERPRLLAAVRSRGRAHGRRRADGGRTARPVRPRRPRSHGHGAIRQRAARRRTSGLAYGRRSRRGRASVPRQHGQHEGLQRRRVGRAHEAGGRRQRPLRAGDVRRGDADRPLRTGDRRRAVRPLG